MATFNTAFGSLPGYKEMIGTTNSTAGGEEKPPTVYGGQTQAKRSTQQPAQTFAKMQEQGLARPAAPAAPTPTAFGQYGGSQQGQQLRNQLQQRLAEFGQAPSRYDTESFKQIRGAQAANLQAEYQGQKKALDEELAGRGLYASSIGGGRMGDLAGQQARATASLDAELLQRAADTQAQDRAQFMQSGQGLAELAGSQDLAQFEANRVAQAATFENQLRAAQFGQQQYEQAGQEAFQGAQSEEAASQAARQFDLSAIGQTGGLSLDLQRLLGSQETERAGLTGQLGGTQTLAGQQQTEQRRQFDIQQRLQEQLGLGGLGVQQQEVGIKQQALQQQATDAAAERTLREALQTRELTAAERQQLTDITSRKELQTQQITAQQAESAAERDIRLRLQSGQITAEQAQQERQLASAATLQSQQLMQQAQQFGLSLNEQQTQRVQQYGISLQELANATFKAQQDASLQGRQLNIAEAQNLAQNKLEADKTAAQKTIAEAENVAQAERLKTQIAGQKDISALDRGVQEKQLAFQNAARLSEQSGVQYTVNAQGQPEVLLDANRQPVRTSDFTQAEEARKQQEKISTLEVNLRRQLGLTEATGEMYDIDPVTGVATKKAGADKTVEARRLAQTEAGLTGTFGGTLTQDALQNAYARAAQLSQVTGQQYDVNTQTGAITPKTGAGGAATGTLAAELQRAGLTGTLGGTATLERLQQNLQNAQIMSQITGKQYTVDANGALVVAGDKGTQTETARQSDLETQLRRQLGLTEASGYVYDVKDGVLTRGTQETVQGQMARSDLLLRLSSALSGLTAEQVGALLGKGTATPDGNTTTQGGGGNPTTTTRDTGVTTTTTQHERTRQTTTTTGSNTPTTGSNTTTTTRSNTTTTTGSNTTTTPRTATEQLAPSWATPSFGATFEGQYAPNGNVGGSGYLVYRSGQWYVASTPPSVGNASTPSGSTISSVYPGYTIYESGQRLVWNGASWVSATNAF